MSFISRDQLLASLRALAVFRDSVNRQRAQHILPFLALRGKGVSSAGFTPYSEGDDYSFFDSFARVRDGDFPYYDPIAGSFRIKSHPHSNVATARKGTFFRTWNAAISKTEANGAEVWRLEPGYLDIIREKVLTKARRTTRVPAIPLAAFLFTTRPFPDDFTQSDLADLIRQEFKLSKEEYSTLFEEDTPLPPFGKYALTATEILRLIEESGEVAESGPARGEFQDLTIPDDDPILRQTLLLLEDGYAGVIFLGPPGTSKSWYAVQVALALAEGEPDRVRKIQFHKSYQYEHFVEGFVPNQEGSGFELREQLMLRTVADAQAAPAARFVVLIDELSRSDPGRVFGELLTYMEPSRRDEEFLLASGRIVSIPPNIVFLATMNSRDKNVSEIDDAFDRRMARISFEPSHTILAQFLRDNKMDPSLSERVLAFASWIQAKYPLGHTFWRSVRDPESLARLWQTQLRFVFEKQFKYEPALVTEIRDKFVEIIGVRLN